MKKKTTDEFIAEARLVHGDKFDYSFVNYISTHIPVQIICPIHGVFEQTPSNHLRYDCYKCGKNNAAKNRTGLPKKRNISRYGFINDCNSVTSEIKIQYDIWIGMIARCYNKNRLKKNPSYNGCSVCEEWHHFSNFMKWLEDPNNGYNVGYHLDKDILVKGNKVYSPETCCFVPPYINTLIISNKARRGKYPIGVTSVKKGYIAQIHKNNELIKLGTFVNVYDAFLAYKYAKEVYIKEIAHEYYGKGLITEKVYNALMRYEVEITD